MIACELCIHSDLCEWDEGKNSRIAVPIYYCEKHKKICKGCCDDFYSYAEEIDDVDK